MSLPDYRPPEPRRAAVACAGSPLIVLVVFIALIFRWCDLELAVAWLIGATIWVGWEMHAYQSGLDAYNAHYARRHLRNQPLPVLLAVADDASRDESTRDFVRRYIDDGGQVRRDRPML